MGELDYLFVCLGGGGLLSGSALAAYALSPRCLVYGVEPEAGNDGQQSLRKGEVVRIPAPKTLADGAATTHLGNLTFPLIQKYVRDIVTVTDDQLVATMKFFAERMKMVVEPTGCLHRGRAAERGAGARRARGDRHQRRQRRPAGLRQTALHLIFQRRRALADALTARQNRAES